MARRIENDEQYDKALLWLTDNAKRIENPHPLEKPEDRDKTKRIYDMTSEACIEYNHRQYTEWRTANGLQTSD